MDLLENKRLLIFAHDAASANSVISYAYLNQNEYSEIKAYYGSEIARKLFSKHIPDFICNDEISFFKTDYIVTGTSGLDSNYELNIIKEAKNKVGKIICIVDNSSNFNMRFTLNNEFLDKKYYPDEIWIYEKNFKSKINDLDKRLIYKQNLYLEYLKCKYENEKPKIKNDFIKKNKFNYLVLLSEYIYELYGLKFGFCEYDIVESFLSCASKLNLDTPIFLKLHPREHKNKFNILLRKYSKVNIVCEECDIDELIFYSSTVFGINSSVFIESQLFGKDTYSLQINSKQDILIKNLNESNIIKTNMELEYILSSL